MAVEWDNILTVDSSSIQEIDIILTGKYSLIGAVHGKVNIIDRFEDLVKGKVSINQDDIVCAVKTSNYWNQFLKHLKGIITVEGSPTAHPMLVGRERHLPCVIGCIDALNRLRPYNKEWVTLDGLTKCVYVGKKPLIKASKEKLDSLFALVKDLPLQPDEESRKFLLLSNRGFFD